MSHLRLACLGSPVVTLDGQTVAFPTRKVLALLVYLAVEGGAHAREKLAALFWPAQDRPQGQQALRTTLTRLRQTLQDRHTDQQAAVYLRIDQHMIGFNGEADCELDVRILQEAVRTLGTDAGRADTAAQNLFLQRAVGSYRGDFLDGFTLPGAPTFDDWVAIQRERYHRQIGLVFEQLSHNQFDTGQIAAAIDTATRWLAHDTLDEAASRQLMRLHFANGDRAAALRVYEACRTILAAELSAEPVPETAALAAQLRATAPPGDDRLRHAADPSVSPAALQTPLIGREREHARLVDAFDTVRRGQAGVVCIEGEAGIGKSALALHFLGWAAAQGADVLRGQAFETGGQLPYQPLLQALRPRLDRENAPEDLLADVWLTELSRLLPELRDRYPDLAVPTSEDATARTRLYESIVRLYLAIAERAYDLN
jgi:DNA-binding SARP family transcriptional activator